MKLKTLLRIYLSVLFIECFAITLNLLPVQFISKPSLMLILMVYLKLNLKHSSKPKTAIQFAILFSWFGDIFLLLDKIYDFLFIYGLLCFLFAHIFYIVFFWEIRKFNGLISKIKIPLIIGVTIYSLGFYWYIYENLNGLHLPVLFYTLVISLMLIASFHAFDLRKQEFGKICIAGTLLFVLSDSILAYNRFASPLPFGSVLVIFTYGLGQLFIIEGAIRNLLSGRLRLK